MSNFSPIYETDRFYVRPFVKDDINGNYQKWWNDQEVTKYNSHGLFPHTLDNIEEHLKSKDNITWAVIAKDEPSSLSTIENPSFLTTHIGNITLQNINWVNRSAEFACVFGEKEYWNNGYCTESANFLFNHGFNKLNLHRIWTGTAATNIGMQKVAERLGMKREGTFKDGTFLNGEFVDIFAYGVLRHDHDWTRNDLRIKE